MWYYSLIIISSRPDFFIALLFDLFNKVSLVLHSKSYLNLERKDRRREGNITIFPLPISFFSTLPFPSFYVNVSCFFYLVFLFLRKRKTRSLFCLFVFEIHISHEIRLITYISMVDPKKFVRFQNRIPKCILFLQFPIKEVLRICINTY